MGAYSWWENKWGLIAGGKNKWGLISGGKINGSLYLVGK